MGVRDHEVVPGTEFGEDGAAPDRGGRAGIITGKAMARSAARDSGILEKRLAQKRNVAF